MTLGDIIKRYREEHGMSQSEFARLSKLSRGYVSMLEQNKNPQSGRPITLTLDTMAKAASAMGMDVNDLFRMVDGKIDLAETASTSSSAFVFSFSEQEIIKKYRTLDGHGKKVVDTILKLEAERPVGPVAEQPKAKKRKDGFTEIKVWDQPAAAGIGNYLDEPAHHMEQIPSNLFPSGAEFGIRISGDSMEPVIHDGQTVFVRPCLTVDSGKVGIFVLNGAALCKQLQVDQAEKQIRLVSLNKSYLDIVVGEQDELRTVGQVVGAL